MPDRDGPYRCDRCGEEWNEHPMLRVPCPKCRAGVGTWCSSPRPSGHRVRLGTSIHVEREQAAMDAGFLQKCPGLPPDTTAALETVAPKKPAPRPASQQARLWSN